MVDDDQSPILLHMHEQLAAFAEDLRLAADQGNATSDHVSRTLYATTCSLLLTRVLLVSVAVKACGWTDLKKVQAIVEEIMAPIKSSQRLGPEEIGAATERLVHLVWD